jgi:hypothetical protein
MYVSLLTADYKASQGTYQLPGYDMLPISMKMEALIL